MDQHETLGTPCLLLREGRGRKVHVGRGHRQAPREPRRVPVVVEFILERVTNISMGNDIDAVDEVEELAERGEDAPTAITLLD